MNKSIKQFGAAAMLSLLAMGVAQAEAIRYQFEITGTVLAGDEFGVANVWNLTAGDTITATGAFTADLGASPGLETGTVDLLGAGSGYVYIDLLGGQIISDDDAIGSITLDFAAGALTSFDYLSTDFNSNFTFFDDFNLMLGSWDSVTLTAVPVPAAVWLFGSGLVAMFGWARRRA